MTEMRDEIALALQAEDRARMDRIIAAGTVEDFETFQALVHDETTNSTFRRKALDALGRWPERAEDTVATIRSGLPVLGEVERIGAVKALERVGTEQALEVITEYADDPAPDVRRQVATALAEIGTPRATEALRGLAASEGVDYVRDRAEELLRGSGSAT